MTTRKSTKRPPSESRKPKKNSAEQARKIRPAEPEGESLPDALTRFPDENPNPVLRVNKKGILLYANSASVPLLRHWDCRKGGSLPREWKKRIDTALSGRRQITVDEPCGNRIYIINIVPISGADYANLYGSDATERKRTDRILRESEDRFRSLYENATIGIYRTTPDGRILLANPALVTMLGYATFDELVERDLSQASFEAGYPRREFQERIEREGVISGLESAWKRRDGSTVFVRESARLIRGEDGKPLYYDGVAEDISSRKLMEEALAGSEVRYRRLFESAKDGILILDEETGEIVDVNPFLVEMLGYPFDQVKGKTIWEIGFLKDIIANWDKFLELRRKEYVRYEDLPLRTADGECRNVEFVSNVYLVDHKKVIQCNIRDITDRKRAEAALRESEDKFKYIFDHSVIGKSITFPTGEIHVNEAFCKMLGYTSKELESSRWQDVSHPEDIDLTQGIIDSLLSGEKGSARFIKRYLHKNGSIVWVEVGTALRRDAAGKPLYFMTALIDITDRKRAEDALRASNSRQRAILEAVPDIIMEVDENKVYTWANRPGVEFFGDDVVGREAQFYFEGEQEVYEQVRPIFDGAENTIYVESWQRRRDGERRLLTWWCRVLKDAEGKVTGALSTARDVTELRRAELDIRKQMDELQRWHDLTLDRETRALELKREVNELLVRSGETIRYPSQENGSSIDR